VREQASGGRLSGLNVVHLDWNASGIERAAFRGRSDLEETMNRLRWLWLAPVLALLLMTSRVAHAVTLFTPVSSSSVGQFLSCIITNVGTTPTTASARLLDFPTGNDLSAATNCPVKPATLAPGTVGRPYPLSSPTAVDLTDVDGDLEAARVVATRAGIARVSIGAGDDALPLHL